MNVIGRKEAIEKGLTRYFTGKPCKNGHLCERVCPKGDCVECYRHSNREYQRVNSSSISEKRKVKYRLNSKTILENKRAKYRENPEAARENARRYYSENRDKVLLTAKEYRCKNLPKLIALNNKRRSDRIQRTPSWSDLNTIRQMYVLRDVLTKDTGIKYEVDHIIPLRGKLVSGLHVPENLQVIPAKINAAKSNKFNIETYNAETSI